jgi:elongation factor G
VPNAPEVPPLVLQPSELLGCVRAAREGLVEALANIDDAVADAYLSAVDAGVDVGASWDTPGLTPDALHAAIRRATVAPGSRVLPLLCGSAYKNRGVQPLLDAVVRYLPSPLDRPPLLALDPRTGARVPVPASSQAPLRALAFKVQRDPQRGPLVFFRVYSGVLTSKLPLLNASLAFGERDAANANAAGGSGASAAAAGSGAGASSGAAGGGSEARERPSKLLQMFADEQREAASVAAGHIGAAVGLKHVKTGDTLCLAGDPHPVLLRRVVLPEPVFTASLEVNSASEQKALDEALAVLTREDPSLVASVNEDTGQQLLSGMGELHLDIAADRLRREYNVPVQLGRMMVSYRETVMGEATVEHVFDKVLGTKRHWVKLAFAFDRITEAEDGDAGGKEGEEEEGGAQGQAAGAAREHRGPRGARHSVFEQMDASLRCRIVGDLAEPSSSGRGGGASASGADADGGAHLRLMPPAFADALKSAVQTSFSRGPLLGFNTAGVSVRLLEDQCEVGPDTSATAVRACVAKCMELGMKEAGVEILEPNMSVEVTVPDAAVGEVLQDLTAQRRAKIKEVTSAYDGGAEGGSGDTGADKVARAGTIPAGLAGKMIIRADVPLRQMVGYSTNLRSRTAGEGSFAMEFAYFGPVGPLVQKRILEDPYNNS